MLKHTDTLKNGYLCTQHSRKFSHTRTFFPFSTYLNISLKRIPTNCCRNVQSLENEAALHFNAFLGIIMIGVRSLKFEILGKNHIHILNKFHYVILLLWSYLFVFVSETSNDSYDNHPTIINEQTKVQFGNLHDAEVWNIGRNQYVSLLKLYLIYTYTTSLRYQPN